MLSLEQHISLSMGPKVSLQTNRIIQHNLNPKFALRPYQKEAFARFNFVLKDKKKKPLQLLFHMATGSGKTLVMAGLILDLYARGYRNFIFFVHSTNIIEKTKDNFLNPHSSKYLFNDRLSVHNKTITIKEVQNFDSSQEDRINIVFTTIQALHSQLNTPRENALTYEDFDSKIVLLSDEAHHINATTKKGKQNKTELKAKESWEGTVNKIFNTNKENILLEFTATADLKHPEIAKKYYDKLIFDYPLKQFRKDAYSKDVKVLQRNLPPFDRALQALILSQYRRKLFEKNGINIKPVLLLKSKSIAESERFYNLFVSKIKQLTTGQIEQFNTSNKSSIFYTIFSFLNKNGISPENFVLELQEDFSASRCIVINSKSDSIEKQLIINSLEDHNNEYRVVFAVDKLNEGWDVLNLFDIVRLYDSRHNKSNKITSTTMSEAQLIGRGARYCPFKTKEQSDYYKRKFDADPKNELKICEDLYYHAGHNPNYIVELNKALLKIGIVAPNSKRKKLTYGKRGTTSRQKPKTTVNGLEQSIKTTLFKVNLSSESIEQRLLSNKTEKPENKSSSLEIKLQEIPFAVIRKALNSLNFYRFDTLQKHFPKLSSITEFITSEKYCRDLNIRITGYSGSYQQLSNNQKLRIAISIFKDISELIK